MVSQWFAAAESVSLYAIDRAQKYASNARQLTAIVNDEDNTVLPASTRPALQPVAAMLIDIEAQIGKLDKDILPTHRNDNISKRLATIPAFGTVSASCLSASVPDARAFKCGREFAAWIGLVPRQFSTGGKPRPGSCHGKRYWI